LIAFVPENRGQTLYLNLRVQRPCEGKQESAGKNLAPETAEIFQAHFHFE
jgi:hypothetical protein